MKTFKEYISESDDSLKPPPEADLIKTYKEVGDYHAFKATHHSAEYDNMIKSKFKSTDKAHLNLHKAAADAHKKSADAYHKAYDVANKHGRKKARDLLTAAERHSDLAYSHSDKEKAYREGKIKLANQSRTIKKP